jgi:hypothetical protein
MKYLLLPVALAAAVTFASASVTAQTVVPPPLPIAAQQVRPEAGLHLEERKRHVRAHHHKMQHKKDYTRDDDEDNRGGGKKDKDERNDRDGRNDRPGARAGDRK